MLIKYQVKAVKNALLVGLSILGVELALIAYDTWMANNDGFIKNYHIVNSFRYVWLGWFLAASIAFIITSKYTFLQNFGFSTLSFVVIWAVLEVLFLLLYKFQVLQTNPPYHRFTVFDEQLNKLSSGDFNAFFGRWSTPYDSSFRTRPAGDSIKISYNAFGARDKQRSTHKSSTKKRIIVIGDSFVEGYMLDTAQRFTNLMERATNCEHLNIAINGTGLITYFLEYKYLAKRFEHDVVMIGILPANDFEVHSENDEMSLFDSPIYRPYWRKVSKGNYELKYSLASINQSIASYEGIRNPRIVVKTVDSLYRSINWYKRPQVELNQNSYLYKGVLELAAKVSAKRKTNDTLKPINTENIDLLTYFLAQLRLETQGKKVILVVFPIEKDLKGGDLVEIEKFNKTLTLLCSKNGFGCIDILPYFKNYKGNISDLYTKGDGHWSAKGDSLAAQAIMNHPLYKQAIK